MANKKKIIDNIFGKLDLAAHVTNGVCSHCHNESMFISLTSDVYRCVTCGSDCHQHINGKINYLPITSKPLEDGPSTKVRG